MHITKENKFLQAKEFVINSKGYSNLIFNQNTRGDCALNNYSYGLRSKPINREYNIMLLKRGRKNSHSQDFAFQKNSKSVQMPYFASHKNQMNVINLMTYSMAAAPKIKSNYCNRITLTNVDKYYKLCLKKVKDIGITSFYKQNQFVQNRTLSSNKNRSKQQILNPNQHNNIQNSQLKDLKPTDSYQQAQKTSRVIINFLEQNLQAKGSLSKQIVPEKQPFFTQDKICSRNQRQQTRNIYSSALWRSGSPSARRNLKTSQQNRRYLDRNNKNKKGQFVIQPWQSTDNLVDDIF